MQLSICRECEGVVYVDDEDQPYVVVGRDFDGHETSDARGLLRGGVGARTREEGPASGSEGQLIERGDGRAHECARQTEGKRWLRVP